MKNVVLYVVMVTGLTALFVWLKGRNAERDPASSAMVVSPEDAAARPVVLVDVRTLDEYRTGHKEGALNIPADEVEQLAPRLLPDKNAVIMLYCRTGKRADKALEALRKMGYSHVENLHRFEM
ncbi:MAG: rhodanese-like domain-containing protein [Akkermansia sp.]|uniref:rhodanese-like domain-containing protein n=1 Tax=Akkermansia sp. TaxID=1872421 RepID=UPI00258BEAC3|nr:rhodanese-like domain-containing protein [Akkermansia sp.]MCD8248017.1 rhodanese-like domain-containing protein [Akkermansia sp.]MCI7761964.1 rhodanese-like domain-containing protein [Akkermansia muciniphila]MDY5392656.1 rhodanese-like domain-containing protein [Akkermansia muciniphila]